MDPPGAHHELSVVEVAWYDEDRIKLTLPRGAPAVIRQAYLTGPGADVIIELGLGTSETKSRPATRPCRLSTTAIQERERQLVPSGRVASPSVPAPIVGRQSEETLALALPTAYLTTSKNLEAIFNSIQSAKAPSKFTQRFLEDLGFKSTTDRLYINLFESALGFLSPRGSSDVLGTTSS